MNAVGASILAFLVFLVLFAPRRWALLAMMAGVLYLTQGQAIHVFGLNLVSTRFLELAGFIRVMVRGEFSFSSLNRIDKGFILVYVYTTFVFLLRSHLGQGTSTDITQVSIMDKIGLMVDAMLCYFTFRGLIQSVEDLIWFLRFFVILLIPYVALLSIERLTRQNPFALLGGLPVFLDSFRIRCVGSFRHPSLLGTFGASFLPLYIGLALTNHNRIRAFWGIGLCLGVVFLSGSSGPLSFAILVIAGWLLWTMRTKMFIVRRWIVGILVLSALVMYARDSSQLWWLPEKVGRIFGFGGDGWHRSYLMDVAFRNMDQWWLVGMPLDLTKGWFPYLVGGAVDITNLFLSFGLDAGLLAIVFFIFLLVRGFRSLGQALAVVRSNSSTPSNIEFCLWGLGVMLAGHISNWITITYFDQTNMVWFMQLAAISSISLACAEPVGVPVKDSVLMRIPLNQGIYRHRKAGSSKATFVADTASSHRS